MKKILLCLILFSFFGVQAQNDTTSQQIHQLMVEEHQS